MNSFELNPSMKSPETLSVALPKSHAPTAEIADSSMLHTNGETHENSANTNTSLPDTETAGKGHFDILRSKKIAAGLAALASFGSSALMTELAVAKPKASASAYYSRPDVNPTDPRIPNARQVIQGHRDTILAQYPTALFYGPKDKEVEGLLATGVRESRLDTITSLKVKKSSGSSFKVSIHQRESGLNTQVASVDTHPESDETGYLNFSRRLDGDLFTKRWVKVTPMIKNSKGKIVPYGKTTLLKDNTTTDLSKLDTTVLSNPMLAPKFKSDVKIKTSKPVSDKLIKSGKFFINVSQGCVPRDPSFAVNGNECNKVMSMSYRVNKKIVTYSESKKAAKFDDVVGGYVYPPTK